MKVLKLLYVLYKIKLLSPITLFHLISSILSCGINLMTLLNFAAKKYANSILLVDDNECLTYRQMLIASNNLSLCLRRKIGLQSGHKVAIICKNHASLVKSIFAISRIGADLYFINTEISKLQFTHLIQQKQFDLLIYDSDFKEIVEQSDYANSRLLSYHHVLPSINNLSQLEPVKIQRIPRTFSGKIVLHTSGTTGTSKEIEHKPTLFNFLNPFVAFVSRLKIIKYNTAYIATPIYHGYGIAVLLLFIPLGKKVIVRQKFNANHACELIKKHHVEVVTVVPTMLQRMLDASKEDLKSLKCIASGGAKLSTKLVDKTIHSVGQVLYNLYGTTEAGLNFIATPDDLLYSSATVGKAIKGMVIRVMDSNMNEMDVGKVGELWIKNEWSMQKSKNNWIQTGDLGYKDQNGYYFLCGRLDDMIISGGVNVYPIEVEQIIMNHPSIEDAAIVSMEDDQFGQRLKAYILLKKNDTMTEIELRDWLSVRISRFQLPKEIEFVHCLPYTSLGKLNRKQLK